MGSAITPPPDIVLPDKDRDALYEVVGGQVVVKTRTAHELQIASLLSVYLSSFARPHRLGRVVAAMLFQLGKDLQRRPDVALVSHERWPLDRRVPDDYAWDVVPDLAIEVISPTNRAAEFVALIAEYFRVGVRCVWVIYPDEHLVHVYDSPTAIRGLTRADTLDGGALLPGFQLPLASLFEDDAESP